MSQAIAPQATDLAISTPNRIDIDSLVEKNAKRTVKGVTRERLLINGSKLFSAVCAEYKSMIALDKSNRLSDEIAAKIQASIDKFIEKQVNRVNPRNAVSFRTYFAHDFRNLRIVERVNALGENSLILKEQLLGVHCLLTAKNNALKDLEKKPTPDYDREASVKEEIRKLELTEQHIKATLAAVTTEETK